MIALALPVGLSGCAGAFVERISGVRDLPATEAFIMPSAGGPSIVGVLEERFTNGIEQEIILSGGGNAAGQNSFTVKFVGTMHASSRGRGTLADRPLALTNIDSEIRNAFPGLVMSKADVYVQNRFGPFGYATGSTSSTRCLYAWQRLSGSGDGPLLFRPNGSINIRLRLCQRGASEIELLATMYNFRVNAFLDRFSWAPYEAPLSPSPTFGAGGAPIYPIGAPATVTPAFAEVNDRPVRASPSRSRSSSRSRPSKRTAPMRAPATPDPLPEPIGPSVPPPPPASAASISSEALQPSSTNEENKSESANSPSVTVPDICINGAIKTEDGC